MSKAPAHLNPFFIEPNESAGGNGDEDYYDYEDDEAYDNFEWDEDPDMTSLLDSSGEATGRGRKSRSGHGRGGRSSSYQKRENGRYRGANLKRDEGLGGRCFRKSVPCWILIIFVFYLFLTHDYGGSHDRKERTNKKHHNDSDTTAISGQISSVVLLGESEAMLDWFKSKLSSCFPDVDVSSGINRPGFLLQDPPTDLDSFQGTGSVILPVVLLQDPYTTFEYYRNEYQHAPHHRHANGTPFEWRDFMSLEWSTDQTTEADKSMTSAQKEKPGVCQFHYNFGRIVPCMANEDNGTEPTALYEHGSDGQAFASVLELRSAHIQNFVREVPEWFRDVIWSKKSKYESHQEPLLMYIPASVGNSTVKDIQTKLFRSIALALNVSAECDAPTFPTFPQTYTHEYVRYVNKHLDWETEHLVRSSLRTWDDLEANSKRVREKEEEKKKADDKKSNSDGEKEPESKSEKPSSPPTDDDKPEDGKSTKTDDDKPEDGKSTKTEDDKPKDGKSTKTDDGTGETSDHNSDKSSQVKDEKSDSEKDSAKDDGEK